MICNNHLISFICFRNLHAGFTLILEGDILYDVIIDAFADTVKMAPIMILVFIGIELFEHKYGKSFRPIMAGSKKVGPVIGAVLGIVPQCGFSVISTLLFAEGAISVGTLLAVYLATSDEAIPIILSQPGKIYTLFPLLLSKFIIAVLAGYLIDGMYSLIKKRNKEPLADTSQNSYEEDGCCGSTCIDQELNVKYVLKHSLTHTLKVLAYVLGVSILLNVIIYYLGKETLFSIFMGGSLLQPVITSVIGLIPNCAVSVAITEVFLEGGITFGSVVAGLSASAGMGLVVLVKEIKSKKTIYTIILLLLAISILSGIIINTILPSGFIN